MSTTTDILRAQARQPGARAATAPAAAAAAPPATATVAARPALAAPVVDIVLPVYNEEAELRRNVLRLLDHLRHGFPFTYRITIADNASTDGTWRIARALARELPCVAALHLDQKGRGRALKAAWAAGDAQVLVYMDIDLATGLDALLPLVAPLVSGHSDLAIGTRLARSSVVERGPKREVISRCYNLLTKLTLRTRFSDAQCGFKAVRADRARALLPWIEDDGWFFDTELLVVAERAGLRIHEVPVDWTDDPDSRVDIVPTAVADLKGIARVGRSLALHKVPLAEIGRGRARCGAARPRLFGQLVSFCLIGAASTLAYAVLYLLLRQAMPAQAANFALTAADGRRQHGRQPPLHLRRARYRRPPAHPGPGPDRLRPGPGRHQRQPRSAPPRRPRGEPQRGARRAHRRQRGRHAAAVRAVQGLDLPQAGRPRTAPGRRRPAMKVLRRFIRGRETDPAWVRPLLLALLGATALLYLIGLGRSGWANSFYSAAVQAGASSWKALFFGSSDAASFITVDKPPLSLWVMAISARLFGVSSWSILVPQALMGVAAVGVLYATVRRWASPAAGLLAGAALALTPVATLMFRFNNPDALLVLLLTLAAYTTVRALEHGSARWLALTGVLIGCGFMTKMLQAFLVVPVFALVYLIAAPTPLRRRLWHLLVAGAALVVSAGWWVAVVELWPTSSRPYIGGSQTNSVLELIFGYNGLGRITGNETGSVVPGGTGQAGAWGATGIWRMFNASWGGQIAWLLPAAIVFGVALLWLTRRAPRTDRTRAATLLWGGTLLVTLVVFSLGKGIIHEYYAVALAPPIGALVGMGAVALWKAREWLAARLTLAAVVLGTSAWAFVLLDRSADWYSWLRFAVVAGGVIAAVLIAVGERAGRRLALAGALAGVVVVLAGPAAYSLQTAASTHTGSLPTAGPQVAGSRGGPGGAPGDGMPGGGSVGGGTPGGAPPAMTASQNDGTPPQAPPGGFGGQNGSGDGQDGAPTTDGSAATGGAPTGGHGGEGGFGGAGGGLLDASTPSSELVALLQKDADQYTWVAATVGAQSAAGYQLATGDPVMSLGGFNGSDPYPTLAEFKALVAAGKVHYYIGGSSGGGPGGAGGSSLSAVSSWVSENFTSHDRGRRHALRPDQPRVDVRSELSPGRRRPVPGAHGASGDRVLPAKPGEAREVAVGAYEQRAGLERERGDVRVGHEVTAGLTVSAQPFEQPDMVAAGIKKKSVGMCEQRLDERECLVVCVRRHEDARMSQEPHEPDQHRSAKTEGLIAGVDGLEPSAARLVHRAVGAMRREKDVQVRQQHRCGQASSGGSRGSASYRYGDKAALLERSTPGARPLPPTTGKLSGLVAATSRCRARCSRSASSMRLPSVRCVSAESRLNSASTPGSRLSVVRMLHSMQVRMTRRHHIIKSSPG